MKLPDNWETMSRNERDAWSLERWLNEAFPSFTFTVTFEPFNVRVNEDGADLRAVQASADDWFEHVYGTRVKWGEPVHHE